MKWIRRLLGLDADLKTIIRAIECVNEDVQSFELKFSKLEASIRVLQAGLGRIIAKLDSDYLKPDLPPVRPGTDPKADKAWEDRKAESDRLANEAIKRLEAEDWARRHTEGHPDAPPR